MLVAIFKVNLERLATLRVVHLLILLRLNPIVDMLVLSTLGLTRAIYLVGVQRLFDLYDFVQILRLIYVTLE
jgi:hypothetical protein